MWTRRALYDNRHCSSGDESPSKHDTPAPSEGEVDNDKSSNDKRSHSIYHIDDTPKKGRLDEKNNVGHKSTYGAWFGMKKTPKANPSSKSDDNLLNFYDTDDVISDNKKSCLSFTDDNGLSFANLDEADTYGFDNWRSAPVRLGKSTEIVLI